MLAFGCMVIHLVRELYLGNINIILLCLSLLALQNYLDGKNRSGSILFGIILLTKPFYLLLLLPLLFRKKLKAIGILAITVVRAPLSVYFHGLGPHFKLLFGVD